MNITVGHAYKWILHTCSKIQYHTSPINLSNPLLALLENGPSIVQFHQIHAQIITCGLAKDTFAASCLLKFTTTSLSPSRIELANRIFSHIQKPDVYSYNIVIKLHSYSPTMALHGLAWYKRLLHHQLQPNEYTLCFLLDCCSRVCALFQGMQVHAQLFKHGLNLKIFAATSLVHMYGECRSLSNAIRVFEQMPERSNVSWGAMFDVCVNCGHEDLALDLFGEMMKLDVTPTTGAIVSVLCACTEITNAKLGREVHAFVTTRGIELSITLGTSLLDMYSKCGLTDSAMKVFSMMRVRSVASWNSLIYGLAINGYENTAMILFEQMEQTTDVQPNELTFLAILYACTHKGLVNDGIRYFLKMKIYYRIVPGLKHYSCMVDLFAKAGMVEEAMEITKGMPVLPDTAIWVAIYRACRASRDERQTELFVAQILKTVPHNSCGYLLLSDSYAFSGRWDDVAGVRKTMVDKSISKEPGCSSISN